MMTENYFQLIHYSEIDRDIIFAEFPSNVKVDLAVAKELVANRLNFTKSKKHYVVIDLKNVRGISNEAQKFMQHPDAGLKNILGAAFIAINPVSVLIANIFIKTIKDFDAKLFTDKENAIEWIRLHKNND